MPSKPQLTCPFFCFFCLLLSPLAFHFMFSLKSELLTVRRRQQRHLLFAVLSQIADDSNTNSFSIHCPLSLVHCSLSSLARLNYPHRLQVNFLRIYLLSSIFFFLLCPTGGVLSNSLAIATDAAHLLTDFASFMISLFAIWIAGRPSTQR